MTGRLIFLTMTALPDSDATTSFALNFGDWSTRRTASVTAPASMIAPSTMLSGGSGSTPIATTLKPRPEGLSSIALTALEPMSRPTTGLLRLKSTTPPSLLRAGPESPATAESPRANAVPATDSSGSRRKSPETLAPVRSAGRVVAATSLTKSNPTHSFFRGAGPASSAASTGLYRHECPAAGGEVPRRHRLTRGSSAQPWAGTSAIGDRNSVHSRAQSSRANRAAIRPISQFRDRGLPKDWRLTNRRN